MTHRSDLYRLAAETLLDARTVGKVLAGERVLESTRATVRAAARKLGITIPEREQVSPQSSDPAPAPRTVRGDGATRASPPSRATHTSNGRPQSSNAHGARQDAPRRRKRAGAGSRARSVAKWEARVAARNAPKAPAQSAQTSAPSTGRVSA